MSVLLIVALHVVFICGVVPSTLPEPHRTRFQEWLGG